MDNQKESGFIGRALESLIGKLTALLLFVGIIFGLNFAIHYITGVSPFDTVKKFMGFAQEKADDLKERLHKEH